MSEHTKSPSPADEARAIGRILRQLEKLPRSAQLRALAYLVARTLDVGTCEASETLYRAAQAAREEEADDGTQ